MLLSPYPHSSRLPRFIDKAKDDLDAELAEFDEELERERAAELLERASPSMRFIDLANVKADRPAFPDNRYLIVGRAAVFDVVSECSLPNSGKQRHRTRFAAGCFRRAIDCEFDVQACLRHDRSEPIARVSDGTLQLWEEADGLHVRIAPYDSHTGRLAMVGILEGSHRGMSIALDPDETVSVWSMHRRDRLQTVVDCGLVEVTIASNPVFSQTWCKLRRGRNGGKR